MTLPNEPESDWTAPEGDIFDCLIRGVEFDSASRPSPGVKPGQNPEIRGRFLTDLVRLKISALPIGVQVHGVTINGKVNLQDVRIDKSFEMRNCTFNSPILAGSSRFLSVDLSGSTLRHYLDMRGSVIEGFLFLRDGFRSETCTLLRDVSVTGMIDLTGSAFECNKHNYDDSQLPNFWDQEVLSLARAATPALYWDKVQFSANGLVNLRYARITTLRDALNRPEDVAHNWPTAGRLRMEGLKYDERASTNPDVLLEWLKLQAKSENNLISYQRLADVLAEAGQDSAADRINLEKQRLITRTEKNWLKKGIRLAYLLLSDGGINIAKVFAIWAIVFVACLVVVFGMTANGLFAPSNMAVVSDTCFVQACNDPRWHAYGAYNIPDYYPAFNPLGYTIDNLVPFVTFGTAADWDPSTPAGEWFEFAMRFAGYVLSAVFLICLAVTTRFGRKG